MNVNWFQSISSTTLPTKDPCISFLISLSMSTQQDIYVAGSKNRPPMLNKENYVPWSSYLLSYAKSRPNGKLIHNSIINGPYVRRMIPEPGDLNRKVLVNETFHVQSDDELTKKELKQIEADDQAIQTILLGLPEDIYAVVDSCETIQEIWFTSTDEESIESYYHCFLKLMNDFKRNKHFLEKIASNLKFLNNLQPEWSRHVTIVYQTKDLHIADYTQLYEFLKYNQKEVNDLRSERLAKIQDLLALMATSNNPYIFPVLHQDQPSPSTYMQQPMPNSEDITDLTTTMNMALALMAKAFKLNYSTPTNNNQRISSNPRNGGNKFRQYAGQNVRNHNGYNVVQNVENQNPKWNGNFVAARAEGNVPRNNGYQIWCYNCRGLDLDEIEEVNVNCILMKNLQQASTSGTQTDKAPVYDSEGSDEVHNYDNCCDNEIFNMFTQKEQYTELLEPVLEPHQVLQNDNNVISEVSSVEQSGKTIEQHHVNVEETRVLYDSLYNNLAIEVEKVNTINHKLRETNVELTTKLARYKNQEKCFEISQEKYDKLERCYQKSVYQKQCLSKRINALHLSFGKQITTLNEKNLDLNKQLSMEKSTVSTLLEEKKKLKSDFKIREDELLDKQIQLENKIKELDNILVKWANRFKRCTCFHLSQTHFTTPNRKWLWVIKIFFISSKMTLDTHNWSSSAHQELHKIVKDEIFHIVNQVDARVQNFEIQVLKDSAKFVRDFKSLAKEADESLAKHKALELEIERLLRAVVSQDIMSVLQNNSIGDTSNFHTELERVDNTTKTKRPQPRSNTKNDRVPSASKSSYSKNKDVEVEEHPRNLLLFKNKKHMSSECTDLAKITKKGPKLDKIEHEIEKIAQKPDPKTFYVY
nr:hypothetical protein [Tanacetum cinerariifolium]